MILNQTFGKDLIRTTRTERTAAPTEAPLVAGQAVFSKGEDVDIVEFSNGNRLVQKHAAGQRPTSYTVEAQGQTEQREGRFEVETGPAVVIKGCSLQQTIHDDGMVQFRQDGPWGFTNSVTLDCHDPAPQKPHEFSGGSLWLDKEKDSWHSAFIDQAWVDSARPDCLQVSVAPDSPGRRNAHAGEQAAVGLLLPWNVFSPNA